MPIAAIDLALSIGEIIGAIIILTYLWKKTDWKQEREFERFMRSIDSEKLPKNAPLQNR